MSYIQWMLAGMQASLVMAVPAGATAMDNLVLVDRDGQHRQSRIDQPQIHKNVDFIDIDPLRRS